MNTNNTIHLRRHHINNVLAPAIIDASRIGNLRYIKANLISEPRKYGRKFRKTQWEIFYKILSNPTQQISIVEGLDDLCETCPLQQETCKIDGQGDFNNRYDFKVGESMQAREFLERLSHYHLGILN